MHITVIGAGWAGLAAAVELCHHGHRVTVFEAARQVGGRARGIDYADLRIDNGQHLLIGAYRHTLALLKRIGITEEDVLSRRRLRLLLQSPTDHTTLDLQAARLPAPLHMLVALLFARGLTIAERWRTLRLCASLPALRNADLNDVSVATLLQRQRQTQRLVRVLWEPLCLAVMNTPTSQASAGTFIRVLCDAFLHRRSDSDLLLPRRDLGAIIPEPASDYIRACGGEVRLGTRITAVNIAGQRLSAIVDKDGNRHVADQFIIATPPSACRRLLAPHALFTPLNEQLGRFTYAPICTVYLQYPHAVCAALPMTGLLDGYGQWLFDRSLCAQPGLMAVVISGHGEHEHLDNQELSRRISAELATLYPHWPAPLTSYIVREKRATFVCDPASDGLRPGHATAAVNTWLAGDYTTTGYPATLEGAVISGTRCAAQLLRQTD